MKVNKYQKIVLILYATAFIYFSIIHVPFKIKRGNEIVYDTLLSNRANTDIVRLSLVIIIITIIAVSLLLLLRNLRLTFKPRIKSALKLKPVSYIILGIIVIALSAFFLLKKYNTNLDLNKSPLSLDSTSTVAQSDTMPKDPLGIFNAKDTMKQGSLPPFVRNRYLYKGKIFRFKDIQDAAKQNNLDLDSYIKKAGIVVVDEDELPIPSALLKKYKTPNGKVVEGTVLLQKYGNRFYKLIEDSTFKVYNESGQVKTVKMVFPDGSIGDIPLDEVNGALKAGARRVH